MAQTFKDSYENYQDHTADSGATNTAIGKARINDNHKELVAWNNWYFARTTKTFTTVASTDAYDLPFNFGKMKSVVIRVGDISYVLKEEPSDDKWQEINEYRATDTSDTPELYHVANDQLEIYPIPTATGTANYGKMFYIRRVNDMTADDYTTGTVTFTNESTTITGSSTVFTSAMVGRWIKGSDNFWYEIESFTSTTVVTIARPYNGSTASGQTYTIGEIPLIPEEYHSLLWYKAVGTYYMQKKEIDIAKEYIQMYKEGRQEMFRLYGQATSHQIINPTDKRNYRKIPDAYSGPGWGDDGVMWDDPSIFWAD